jgi:hypothetical protein
MPDDRGESGGLVTANGDLTLRDYFAAAALTGLGEVCRKQLGGSPRLTAETAYLIADAMLKERSKGVTGIEVVPGKPTTHEEGKKEGEKTPLQ